MVGTILAAALILAAGAATANALDLKDLKDLMPCRSAAVRLCDRTQGVNILARYGQLQR